MPPILGLVIAYLLGSIPAAYLAGKLFRGIDLRQHGSGNLGATNVFRVMGWKIALLVMAFDVGKGVVPVLVLPRWVAPASPHWTLAYGLAAIAGHVRTPFLLWRSGGKGVATALGVFLALSAWATLIAAAVWVVVLAATRYVSAASLCAAAALPVAVAVLHGVRAPLFALSVIVAAFVVWTHRANIGRLRRGDEHRVGRPRAAH